MRSERTKAASLLLILSLAAALAAPVSAADAGSGAAAAAGEQYIVSAVRTPQYGSVGGEWAVLALARSGAAVPDGWFDGWYQNAAEHVRACGGVLSSGKYTEYSRLVLAVTAAGRRAANVAGYDLTAPLCDFARVTRQGVTGAAFALLALDSGGYAEGSAPRDEYINFILDRQLPSGGWALSGDSADPDATAMALQALAKYTGSAQVNAACGAALGALSAVQNADGGFSSAGAPVCESVSQVITALCELGISPDDVRFVKNGRNPVDALLSYAAPGGGFGHTYGGDADEMATEQAVYALADLHRIANGAPSLYRMSDARPKTAVPAIAYSGKTFSDIASDKNRAAVEALAARGIVSGTGGGLFEPERPVARAEYAAMIVHALGLAPMASGAFSDVAGDAWYAGDVDTAASFGIVCGVGEGKFSPDGEITRWEAATMTAAAAKLCGGSFSADGSSDEPMTRSDTAEMIFSMLRKAEKI